jgi:hypothetical protein
MTGFGLVSEHEHPVRAVIGGVIAALLAGLADR